VPTADHPVSKSQQHVNEFFIRKADASAFVQIRVNAYHENNISVAVESSSHGSSLLLSATQIDTPLADPGQISTGKHVQIRLKGARLQYVAVPSRSIGRTEENVVSERRVLEPRPLRHISDLQSPDKTTCDIFNRQINIGVINRNCSFGMFPFLIVFITWSIRCFRLFSESLPAAPAAGRSFRCRFSRL